MNTKSKNQKELLDEERVEKIVQAFQVPEEKPERIIDRVLHNVGLAGNTLKHDGKTTTCITLPEHGLRIHIRRPSISTHDKMRSDHIPYKDQVLNLINNTMFNVLSGIVELAQLPQSEFGLSDQSPITVQYDCTPLKYEHVLRGYMNVTNTETSLYHHYFNLKKREFCGHKFPDGLEPNQKLDKIYDTPSTKEGHDVSVPASYLFSRGIISKDVYEGILLPASMLAYGEVSKFLDSRGIELMDTKIEFGINKKETNKYAFMDELFTSDSSRYALKDLLAGGLVMNSKGNIMTFGKQFARNLANGDEMFNVDQENKVAVHYIITSQIVTGNLFEPTPGSFEEILENDIQKVLETLKS